MLYSLLIEYKEDTFVLQVDAVSPDEALEVGILNRMHGGIRIFCHSELVELRQEIKNSDTSCTEISGLCNVWVNTYLVQGDLVQIHIIATIEKIA